MKEAMENPKDPDLLNEYDFSKGVRANMLGDTGKAQILLGLMMMLPKYSLMLNQ